MTIAADREQKYTEDQFDLAVRMVGEKCRGCLTAMEVALVVIDEFAVTEQGRPDAEREYDLRIGEVCLVGRVVLSEETQACIVDISHPVRYPNPDRSELAALY